MQIMKAPAFAGVHKHQWTLREIIVRLGIKQVGAIAQQIKLMNCFVLSDDNPFDLRRFWEHAVGTALVADRLCKTQAIALDPPPSFDQYWLSALLHDIGKLVLGLFFPTHFAKVMDHIDPSSSFGRDFREAEAQMGHVGLHEEIGQLLLLPGGRRRAGRTSSGQPPHRRQNARQPLRAGAPGQQYVQGSRAGILSERKGRLQPRRP